MILDLQFFGGRGASSSGGGEGGGRLKPALLPTARAEQIMNAKDFKELKDVAEQNGIILDNKLRLYDEDVVKNAVLVTARYKEEFPDLKNQKPIELKTSTARSSYAFQTSNAIDGDKGISLAQAMKNKQLVNQHYENDVKRNFHPEGTTANDIVAHEMGHALVSRIVHKSYDTPTARMADMKTGKTSANIVKSSYDKLKNKETISKEVSKISRYAMKNPDETIAEACADVFANGNKAKPLSKEIWKTLKSHY